MTKTSSYFTILHLTVFSTFGIFMTRSNNGDGDLDDEDICNF